MTRIDSCPSLPHHRHGQRGIASIEFAFVFMVLFLLLYGIATFGSVFYMQQAITRAAEDGARVVGMFNSTAELEDRIRTTVLSSLGSPLKDTPGLQITSPTAGDPIVVTVTYPYRNNALLPPLPFTATWMPDTLRGRAAAAKPSL